MKARKLHWLKIAGRVAFVTAATGCTAHNPAPTAGSNVRYSGGIVPADAAGTPPAINAATSGTTPTGASGADPIFYDQLTPQARLRKMSLHIRGYVPTSDEYKALASVLTQPGADVSKFYVDKANEYLATPAHVGKMIDRLDELFKLKLAAQSPELQDPTAPNRKIGTETLNAMDLTFREVIKSNLSWDLFLISKKYTVLNPENGVQARLSPSDLGYLNAVAPTLPPSYEGVIKSQSPQLTPAQAATLPKTVTFDDDDARIAGVLTTSRFQNRYSTTNGNKNRGRAAAVFRVFLCDDMKAVFVPTGDDTQTLLDEAFPGTGPMVPTGPDTAMGAHPTLSDEQRHGTDPTCMACHYKLDPLGRTLTNMGMALAPQPAGGRLTYKRADGSLVDVAARGVGDIGRAMAAQPEYAQCQVRHFWDWFVGNRVTLTDQRLLDLTKKFDELEHKPNDFISYLVNQPEFFETPLKASAITFAQIKPTLNNCASCHAGLGDDDIANLAIFPFKNDIGGNAYWLKRIARRMDLGHDGAGIGAAGFMPPPGAAWRPSSDDVTVIKQWIRTGAKDDTGAPTITDDDITKVLGAPSL